MKILLPAIFLSIGGMWAYGQTNSVDSQQNMESIRTGNSMFRSFDNRDKEVQGTVNIFADYLPGAINMTSGKTFFFDRMNYDGYNDLLVVMRKQDEEVVTTMMINSFYMVFGLDTIRFDRYVRPDKQMGFLQRVKTGQHVKLYKRRFRKLESPSYTGAYSSGKLNPELVDGQQFMIQFDKQMPKEISNRKTFARLFPEKEKELSSFMKENKSDFRKEEDMIPLVMYLDDLLDATSSR
jgi:hypothetical protein